ncbi:DGQHR domain-containing protein [Bacillus cereus]
MLTIKDHTHFEQLNMNIYMFSLPIKEILNNYKVHTYEESSDGYQRPPIASHYKSIASYLIENTDSIFLPSAILAAIDFEDISFDVHTTLTIQQELRIVDGQHRLKGFEFAIEKLQASGDFDKLEKLHNFELPIILMVINRSRQQQLNEINAFIDINSKGKKVSTDLAITLRDRIYDQTSNYYTNESKRKEKIATETSKYLTKKASFSVWYSAIKMTPSDKETIISVNSFNKSLYPIIDLIDTQLIKLAGTEEDIQEEWVQYIIEVLPLFVSDAWNVISHTWAGCFTKNSTKKFNKSYNIQKGIGVHALHQVLFDCLNDVITNKGNTISNIKDINSILLDTITVFRDLLKTKTFVISDDWESGKKFSGYNSSSGFRKVKNYILNGKFTK